MGAPKIMVTTVGGVSLEVQSVEEKQFFDGASALYQTENVFTAITDKQDLDRLLGLELLDFRLRQWIGAGRDYSGNLVDEVQLARQLKDISAQITSVKNSMGLSRSEREKDAHDSVGAYIIKLKQAGKAFGIHRNKQAAKAIGLLQECLGLARTWERSNEFERKKLGLDAEYILEWLLKTAGPEFDKIDTEFRASQQRYFEVS